VSSESILDSLDDAIVATDLSGVITFVNPGACVLFEVRPEDALGARLNGLCTLYDRHSGNVIDSPLAVLHPKSPTDELPIEFLLVTRNGRRRRVEHFVRILTDEAGGRVGATCVFRDNELRTLADETLRQDRNLFLTIIDNLPDCVYAKDREGRKILSNPADVRGIGKESEIEVLGKTDFDLFPHEMADGFFADDMHVITTGDSVINREERNSLPGAPDRWILTTKVPLRTVEGDIIGLVGIGRDITNRKIIEAELKESQQLLMNVLQSYPDPTFVIDRAGVVTAWNKALEELTGISAHDIIGKGNHEYAIPFYQRRQPMLIDLALSPTPELVRKYRAVQRGDSYATIDIAVKNLNGRELVWLSGSATPLFDSTGAITGAIESIRDNTAQKTVEEELRKSEERFRLISDNVADHIVLLNEEHTCLYASLSFQSEGYYQSDLLNARFTHYVHPDDAPAFLAAFAEVVEKHRHKSAQFRLLKKNGGTSHLEATMSLLIDDRGANVISVMRDVSARIAQEAERTALQEQLRERNVELEASLTRVKTMQETLVQSEKMASIGQLTAGIAHEINNPLSFVSSNLERFDEYFAEAKRLIDGVRSEFAGVPDPAIRNSLQARFAQLEQEADFAFVSESFTELMKHTQEGTDRIRKIVAQLKGFSRIAEPGFESADINAALEDSVLFTWNELKYKVTVNRDLTAIPTVECNLSEIKQVFVNLLVNASHAIPERGEITLRTIVDGERVLIAIGDTGTGIPPENLKRIFDPFFTTKPVGKGTGLGLWICSTIIEKHRGTLTVESELGKGTTFTITLPLRQTKKA
jgi:two-component system, NtrC family, sensor kinase